MKSKLCIIFLFLIFSTSSFSELDRNVACRNTSPKIPQSECYALVDFYNATGGDRWRNNQGWGSQNLYAWVGLSVESVGNKPHVTGISLPNNDLSGALPDLFEAWPEIYFIQLDGNQLTGEIPRSIGTSHKLEVLNLSQNKMVGSIPDELIGINRVGFLHLAYNQFAGDVPSFIFEFDELGYLDLSGNRFSGSIDSDLSFGDNIITVHLNDNSFVGEIPSGLFHAKQLLHVYLGQNYFSGSIPEEIGEASRLEILLLEDNLLSGEIPASLAKAKNLKHLYLYGNHLSGEIPSELADLFDLEALLLGGNKFVGGLPSEIGYLRKLESLDLAENYFTGDIPSSWKNLKALKSLNLSGNMLSGELKVDRFPSENLEYLSLSENKLSGIFPMEILSFPKINRVEIKNNLFLNDFQSSEVASRVSFSFASNPPRKMKNYGSIDYSVSSNIEGQFISLPSAEGHGGVVIPVAARDTKVKSISGCDGSLNGEAWILPEDSSSCTVSLEFESCSFENGTCLSNQQRLNGVSVASIENPAGSRVLSGVVQLRGWYYDPIYIDYLSVVNSKDVEQKLTLIVDDMHSFDVSTYLNRADVTAAMELADEPSYLKKVGWNVLINSAILSNGSHKAALISASGKVLDQVEFSVFNPLLESGNGGFVNGNYPDIWVDDFPFEGSSVKLSFNVAEQNFAIVDQLINGVSSRSEEQHYESDSLVVNPNKNEDGRLRTYIEYPNSNFPLAGVASLRGWNVDVKGETGRSDNGFEYIIDGEHSLAPKADERPDVKSALNSQWSNSGRSSLFYSGAIKNGMHRIRYWGADRFELLAEAVFESFVPLNALGEQEYLSGIKRTVRYEDFPFQGSEVELSFDQASQSFVVSRQWVNGVEVN